MTQEMTKKLEELGFVSFGKWAKKHGISKTAREITTKIEEGMERYIVPLCRKIEKEMREAVKNSKDRLGFQR